ncbi:hypothetical protein [Hymenobacter sp. UYP22]
MRLAYFRILAYPKFLGQEAAGVALAGFGYLLGCALGHNGTAADDMVSS